VCIWSVHDLRGETWSLNHYCDGPRSAWSDPPSTAWWVTCRCATDHENWKTVAYHTSCLGAALVTSLTAHWLQASCSCAQPASTVPRWKLSALDRHRPPLTAIGWWLDVCHKKNTNASQRQEIFRLWNSLPVALRDRDISLYSLTDFWRHFGLCSAVAHSDCCFYAPCTNILTYLLTAACCLINYIPVQQCVESGNGMSSEVWPAVYEVPWSLPSMAITSAIPGSCPPRLYEGCSKSS